MSVVTVVHLVRGSNGIAPVRRFLESYLRYSAGVEHEMLVICKGVAADGEIRSEFDRAGMHPRFKLVSDGGVDIGAYLGSVADVRSAFVCFLNSFSQIRAQDWLIKLLTAAQLPGVGVSGATGSFESLSYYLVRNTLREWRSFVSMRSVMWAKMRAIAHVGTRFPWRPNPHVRTNAFVIRNSIFKGLELKGTDKESSLEFESGYASMSRQIDRLGLRSVVVGANGRIFETEQWPESNTFRYLNQENLLVHDNQTLGYQNAVAERRTYVGRLAWGNRYRASE